MSSSCLSPAVLGGPSSPAHRPGSRLRPGTSQQWHLQSNGMATGHANQQAQQVSVVAVTVAQLLPCSPEFALALLCVWQVATFDMCWDQICHCMRYSARSADTGLPCIVTACMPPPPAHVLLCRGCLFGVTEHTSMQILTTCQRSVFPPAGPAPTTTALPLNPIGARCCCSRSFSCCRYCSSCCTCRSSCCTSAADLRGSCCAAASLGALGSL